MGMEHLSDESLKRIAAVQDHTAWVKRCEAEEHQQVADAARKELKGRQNAD